VTVPAEFIYTTYKLSRHYPPDRTVLEAISISFFPGAKIGVIGPNGSGKSSLLRIMAGLDDGYNGEARLTPGFSVGYLSQEPQLDPTKTVKENVLDVVPGYMSAAPTTAQRLRVSGRTRSAVPAHPLERRASPHAPAGCADDDTSAVARRRRSEPHGGLISGQAARRHATLCYVQAAESPAASSGRTVGAAADDERARNDSQESS
jgi:energy-coupling factor transporter ATP-binding protein EcfA2